MNFYVLRAVFGDFAILTIFVDDKCLCKLIMVGFLWLLKLASLSQGRCVGIILRFLLSEMVRFGSKSGLKGGQFLDLSQTTLIFKVLPA